MCNVLQVPLKRVNQAYVIATSTKVDIKDSDVSKMEDSHFKAAEKPKEKKGEDGFFKKDTEPEEKVGRHHRPECGTCILYFRHRQYRTSAGNPLRRECGSGTESQRGCAASQMYRSKIWSSQ